MKTEVYDNPADFLAAVNGRRKRGRNTRPDLSAAGKADRTGLTSLISPKAESGNPAWSLEYVVGRGYRLYQIGGPSTDWCPTEAAVCMAAKAIGSR